MFSELITEFSRSDSTKESRLEAFTKAVSQHEHFKNLIRTHEDVLGKLCESFKLQELPNETVIYTRNSIVKDMYWILQGHIGCWEKKSKEELDYEQRLINEITALRDSGEDQMWDKKDRMATLISLLSNIRSDQENDMVRKFDETNDLFQTPNVCLLKRERFLNDGEIIGENCVISGLKYDGLCVVECSKCIVMHLDASVYKTIFRSNIQNFHFIKEALYQVFGFANTKYITRLAYQFEELPYTYNQVIYNEGELANSVYIIKSGEVELRSTTHEEDHGLNSQNNHDQQHHTQSHRNSNYLHHHHEDIEHMELINTYKRRFKTKKHIETQISLCNHGLIGLEDFEDTDDQKKELLGKSKKNGNGKEGTNDVIILNGSPDKKKTKYRTLKAISKSNDTVLLRIRDKYIDILCKDQGFNRSKIHGHMKQQKANYHKDRLEKLHLFLQKKEEHHEEAEENKRPQKALHLFAAQIMNLQAFKDIIKEQKKDSPGVINSTNHMTSSVNHLQSGNGTIPSATGHNNDNNSNNNPMSSLNFIPEITDSPASSGGISRRIFSKPRAATYCKTLNRIQKDETSSTSSLVQGFSSKDSEKPSKGGFMAALKKSIAQVQGIQEEGVQAKNGSSSNVMQHQGSFSQLTTQSHIDTGSSQGQLLYSPSMSSPGSLSMSTLPKYSKNSHKTHKLELLEESANEMQQDEKQKGDSQDQIKDAIASNSQNNDNNVKNINHSDESKPQIESLCNLIEHEEEGVTNNVYHNFVSSQSINLERLEAKNNNNINTSQSHHDLFHMKYNNTLPHSATFTAGTQTLPINHNNKNNNNIHHNIPQFSSASNLIHSIHSNKHAVHSGAGNGIHHHNHNLNHPLFHQPHHAFPLNNSQSHLDLLFQLPEKTKRTSGNYFKNIMGKTATTTRRCSQPSPLSNRDYFSTEQQHDEVPKQQLNDPQANTDSQTHKQRLLLIQSEYTPQITKKTLKRSSRLYASQQNLVSLQFNHDNQPNTDTKQQKINNTAQKESPKSVNPQNIISNNSTLPQQTPIRQGHTTPPPLMRTCNSFNLSKSSNNIHLLSSPQPGLTTLQAISTSVASPLAHQNHQTNIFSNATPQLNQEPMNIISYSFRHSLLQNDLPDESFTPKPRQSSLAPLNSNSLTQQQISTPMSCRNSKVIDSIRRKNYINPQQQHPIIVPSTSSASFFACSSQIAGSQTPGGLSVKCQSQKSQVSIPVTSSQLLQPTPELPTFLIKRKQIANN